MQQPSKPRSLPQSALFHAICGEVARQATFYGQKRSARDWKVIFCSAFAVATEGESEVAKGLEGEIVQLRESTARMSSERFAMLLEYVFAWAAMNGIELQK